MHQFCFLRSAMKKKRSAGARAAAPMLRNLEKQLDLEIKLVINLDAISDQGDGSNGRVVTYGSIGKLLLTAFVHGKQTHAGYPQDGVNAAYVAAELLTEFELSPLLSERTGEEMAAPPTALHSKDSKSGYNVTTPSRPGFTGIPCSTRELPVRFLTLPWTMRGAPWTGQRRVQIKTSI